MKDLVRAGGVSNFEALVESFDGDSKQILAQAGLKSAELSDPDRYISYEKVMTALEIAATELGRPDLGFQLAARQEITFLGALGIAIQAADNPLSALQSASQYLRYHTPGAALNVEKRKEERFQVSFSLLIADALGFPQVVEHAISHIVMIIQLISRGELSPLEIHFRHQQQSAAGVYKRFLGQVPRFASSFNGVLLDSRKIRLRYRDTNPLLDKFTQRYLLGAMVFRGDPIEVRVGRLTNQLLRVRTVDLTLVANLLNIEPRTLQRRLKESGTSFQQIADEGRRQLALNYLSQAALPLIQVCDLLGFADQSSFTRTCKRWFDATPRQVRLGALTEGQST